MKIDRVAIISLTTLEGVITADIPTTIYTADVNCFMTAAILISNYGAIIILIRG